MNERFLPHELTAGIPSSKLNIRSAMPEPQKEEPIVPEKNESHPPKARNLPRPESLQDLMRSQAERETARAIMEEARKQGKTLSEDQRRTVRDSGIELAIFGGADVPENDSYNPDQEQNEQNQGSEILRKGFELRLPRGGSASQQLLDEIEKFNSVVELGLDFDDLKREAEKIMNLQSVDPNNPITSEQKQDLIRQLSKKGQEIAETRMNNPDRFGFYLETQDLRELDDDPIAWLDSQFSQIYDLSKAGSELDSPVLQRVQTEVGEASAYLQKRFGKFRKEGIKNSLDVDKAKQDSRLLLEFNETFAIRLNLIFARTAIDQRGMEQIQGAVGRLRTLGFAGAQAFDNGAVGTMYNRMEAMLGNLRLAEGGREHHLNPASLNKLQEKTIEEQKKLAKEGVGIFADKYKEIVADPKKRLNADDVLEREITRSVRTAYDILVVSQRVAIVASRGNFRGDRQQYFSDNGGAFAVFNLEQMTINKWDLFNHEEQEFFDFLKLDMAINNKKGVDVSGLTREQLLDLGGRLFRDLYVVPDFYSSSWRMNGMRDQLGRVIQYKAENDKMIEKLIEDPNYTPADERLVGLQRQMRADKESYMQAWDERNPSNRILPGDREIAQRQFSRQMFEKVLTRDQRELCLRVLTPDDMMDVINVAIKKAGTQLGKEVGDFALFVQLKQSLGHLGHGAVDDEEKKNYRTEVWEKIQKFKTEDVIQIIRGRARPDIYTEDYNNLRELYTLFEKNDPELGVLSNEQKELQKTGGIEAFHTYDRFIEKYGSVIQAVRQDAMRNSLTGPEQVDMTNLNSRQIEMVNRMLGNGAAVTLQNIYKDMNKFINRHGIVKELVTSHKYIDLYNRVINVEDVMLDTLESIPENAGFQKLSEYFTAESGADALKRNFNDIGNAVNAGNAFIKFVTTEDKDGRFKESKVMKGAVEAYNGRGNGAEVMRFTYGTELLYALQYYWVNTLRLGALPFRKPTSVKQEHYGIGAKSLTRQDVRADLDHHKTEFVGRGADADQWFIQLEELTGTDMESTLKRNALTLLIYAFLGIAVGAPVGAAAAALAGAQKG
jgi:hypothetical protein